MARDALDTATLDLLSPALLRIDTTKQPGAPILQRIEINWLHLIKRRSVVLETCEGMPAYLLLPEVHQLLDAAKHANNHLLLTTLWHTGARISECLALTKASFTLTDEWGSHVILTTLKQRGRPAETSREKNRKDKKRVVPITDPVFLDELQRYFATHPLKKNERIFPITRQAADKRLRQLTSSMAKTLPIDVSCHTLRHSFAINAVLHGEPLTVIRDWLGHADLSSTEIYTSVLTTETNHLMRYMNF
jgi:site-specific recombinase XerD